MSLWVPTDTNTDLASALLQLAPNLANPRVDVNTWAHTNAIYRVSPPVGPPFVVREVNPTTFGAVENKATHVEFEVELLTYLARRVAFTPEVLLNAEGNAVTYVGEQAYVAFSRMKGEPVANFNDLTGLTAQRLESMFYAAGLMSSALGQFRPSTPLREATVSDFCRNAIKSLQSLLPRLDERGKHVVIPHKSFIFEFATEAMQMLEDCGYDKLPRQAVHFDMHAGNALFQGDTLTAWLDWDWARMDNRLADLASLLAMTTYVYGGDMDGQYDLERMRLGARAFRDGFGKSDFSLQQENDILEAIFMAYLVFQFAFTVEYYINDPSDESLIDMEHFLNLITLNDHHYLIQHLS